MTLPFYFSPTAATALDIRKNAEDLYKTAKFNCSEAVLYALRNAFFPELPNYLIAAMSGFPNGIGGAGCSCGAVIGAVTALGLIFGRENPQDLLKAGHCMNLSREIHDRFREQNATICCRNHTRNLQIGSPEHAMQCTKLTGDAAEIAAEIILRETGHKEKTTDKTIPAFTPETKIITILSTMPEAVTIFQKYGMTCLAAVIANDETLRVAVSHKNLPLDKICDELNRRNPHQNTPETNI